MRALTTIAFDADDTLWQNEQFYRMTTERFAALLSNHTVSEDIEARLLDAQKRNIGRYGFGMKGFILSMIETAIEATEGRVPAAAIADILAAGREMLAHPVELLPHARQALDGLAGRYRLVLLTKGDLFDQERKIAESGLRDYFDAVEIVSEKDRAIYERVFSRHGDGAERSMMIGNSLRSDVLPAIEAGSWGVYVPHDLTWSFEHAQAPAEAIRFRQIAHLGELLPLIEEIAGD